MMQRRVSWMDVLVCLVGLTCAIFCSICLYYTFYAPFLDWKEMVVDPLKTIVPRQPNLIQYRYLFHRRARNRDESQPGLRLVGTTEQTDASHDARRVLWKRSNDGHSTSNLPLFRLKTSFLAKIRREMTKDSQLMKAPALLVQDKASVAQEDLGKIYNDRNNVEKIDPDQKSASFAAKASIELPDVTETPTKEVFGAQHPEAKISIDNKTLNKTETSSPCLPKALVIGVQKGGTTSWHVYLKNGFHPNILVPQGLKECDYFSKWMDRGHSLEYYLKSFPGVKNKTDCNPIVDDGSRPIIRVEASPNYLVHPKAAQRAHEILPDAKIIVILRDPIARAVSAYNMKWQERMCGEMAWKMPNCHEQLPEWDLPSLQKNWTDGLRALVNHELSILETCYHRIFKDQNESQRATYHLDLDACLKTNDMDATRLWHHLEDESTLFRSIYVDQLTRWMSYYPAKSFLFWSSEEFEQRPVEHMKAFVRFMGLDPRMARSDVVNWKHHQRDYVAQVPKDVRNRLTQFFAPHNQRLYRLLRQNGFDAFSRRLANRFNACNTC